MVLKLRPKPSKVMEEEPEWANEQTVLAFRFHEQCRSLGFRQVTKRPDFDCYLAVLLVGLITVRPSVISHWGGGGGSDSHSH